MKACSLVAARHRRNYVDRGSVRQINRSLVRRTGPGCTGVIVAFLPRSLLHRMATDHATAWHANVVLSHTVLLSAISLSSAVLPPVGRWPHVCLGRNWIGSACPGCGITTSVDCLMQGNLQGSLAANPAGPVLVACLVLHLFLHAFAIQRRERRRFCNLISNGINVSCCTVLLAVWLHRLLSHHF